MHRIRESISLTTHAAKLAGDELKYLLKKIQKVSERQIEKLSFCPLIQSSKCLQGPELGWGQKQKTGTQLMPTARAARTHLSQLSGISRKLESGARIRYYDAGHTGILTA